MSDEGWKQLLPSTNPFRGQGRFPVDAASEFLPPPRLGWKPYANEPPDPQLFQADDPWGWFVNEYQEQDQLRPGLEQIACEIVEKLFHLLGGKAPPGLKHALEDNLAWPADIAQQAGKLKHDHCVLLAPLALSRTQDDKGRVRWTFFGNSEQGPAKAFWKSFLVGPDKPGPQDQGPRFLAELLRTVYKEAVDSAADIMKAGLRILPMIDSIEDFWAEDPLPAWAQAFVLDAESSLEGVKYLLTFRPFSRLPEAVRQAYLRGDLHLLPTPASLIFWGSPRNKILRDAVPLLAQMPMLYFVRRCRSNKGLRVPQSGFLHVATDAHPTPSSHHELIRNTFLRTHRWDKILRDEDELTLLKREHCLEKALFSNLPDDCGLYDKPMARNVQMWKSDGHLLLDGPAATRQEIEVARHIVLQGGPEPFGYCFHYPAMRVGRHAVYWQRPLVSYFCPDTNRPILLKNMPLLGYLTAYQTEPDTTRTDPELAARGAYRVPRASLEKPVELWPRLLQRQLQSAVLPWLHESRRRTCALNVLKLTDAFHFGGERPLRRALARHLLTLAHGQSLEDWLATLDQELAAQVTALIEPEDMPLPRKRGAKVPESLTYRFTAKRAFEVNYWNTIASLAESGYLNKNNADVILDARTRNVLTYPEAGQLDELAEHLLAYYAKQIAAVKCTPPAQAGSLPFQWKTDFDFEWMAGWVKNKDGPAERNLLVRIPGKDRSHAVIMADHYDTAYEADKYEQGGKEVRIAASGADDNHSATAALMLAAPIFLKMSAAGQLGCDVWLVHLTGEEFPADCLGARHLCQALVEGNLTLHLPDGSSEDVSGAQVKALYVSDMIAHNKENARDIFQIAPGTSRASLWCAEQAQIATSIWNASVRVWNERPERKGRGRGRRSRTGAAIPEIAAHLELQGQVRPPMDPRSTLYNTDGQIFSDVGVPTVLFMENYDINRCGYHDQRDTMENIDLDYGAALAAIVIETVARAATQEMLVTSQT
jgi:hypothetical protein